MPLFKTIFKKGPETSVQNMSNNTNTLNVHRSNKNIFGVFFIVEFMSQSCQCSAKGKHALTKRRQNKQELTQKYKFIYCILEF